MKFKYIVGANL